MDGCTLPAGIGFFLGCSLLLILLLTSLGVAGLKLGQNSALNTDVSSEKTLGSIVPPNFSKIFIEAEEKSKVPAPLIAALFLTEHHTDSFGKDLASLDQSIVPCKENSSGAAGPMQFIPSSWSGVVTELKRSGIESPDRCKYRDSIIGAGFLLAGKAKYPSVKSVCLKNSTGEWQMTDECISTWGQSYCGVNGCNNKNCGAPSYLYCEQVVRKYKLVAGSI